MSTEKTNARNRHAAPIGLVFIVLCVIGLCTVFNWCYGLTRNLADNTAQNQVRADAAASGHVRPARFY